MNKRLINPIWGSPIWEMFLPFNEGFNEGLLKELNAIGSDIAFGIDDRPHDSLWDYDTPHLNQLKKTIIAHVNVVVQSGIPEAKELNITFESHMCWPNIREPGETLEVHAHTDSTIACTYFVKAAENCGDLILFESRDAINWEEGCLNSDASMKERRIKPMANKLVFFPAYILHTVEENRSNDLRITITCDLKKVIDKSAPNAIVLKSWADKMVKICLEE
jgi:uncharacterized protein (TIGR02466 family)